MNTEQFVSHNGRFKEVYLNDLIMPIFIREDIKSKNPVKSMPGIFQYSVEEATQKAKEIEDLGIPAIILFGIPRKKDERGSEAYNPNGIIQQAIGSIKKNTKELILIADCCLCEYTKDGECGIACDGTIDNDTTLNLLKEISLSQAKAGADIIAPSGMISKMVASIRTALEENNFKNTKIMSYSAKYASNFYGPFREACGSEFQGGVRKTQLDYRDSESSVKEVLEDIREGADIVMVKPALSYLDIIAKVRQSTDMTLAAYNVSGEYSMVKFAAQNSAINEEKVVNEILSSIKRAGADFIITYFAEDVAKRHK